MAENQTPLDAPPPLPTPRNSFDSQLTAAGTTETTFSHPGVAFRSVAVASVVGPMDASLHRIDCRIMDGAIVFQGNAAATNDVRFGFFVFNLEFVNIG